MLTQGKFLISYQIFDNIQVNNIGQTHVREILKDTQAFTINYRTEQIRDYLKYPGEELISEHLHMINALKEIQNYWNLTSEKGNHNRYHTYSSARITMICIYKIKVLNLYQKINLVFIFKIFRFMITIDYIMSTYHIGTYNLDIRDILKSYIIARYYGWEPKEEDLEEIISHTSYFDIHVDDAIYEVLTMPREEITI